MWKSKVDELARQLSKPVQATAISAKMRRDSHKFLVKSRTYNGTMDWLANACAQMSVDPFHAIIASENPANAEEVLVAEEFAKDEPPFQIAMPGWNWIPRNAAALANCAGLLLNHCEEIRLVDPHFDPSEPRFQKTFAEILRARPHNAPRLRLLEIHRERPDPFVVGAQRSKFIRHLAQLFPTGLTLRVFFWQQIPGGLEMHPRFLLTDLGGMNFENGLDEGESGTVTLVTLLDHPVWQKCVSDYCRTGTTFSLGADSLIEIRGEG
jgi:hypothetical protein